MACTLRVKDSHLWQKHVSHRDMNNSSWRERSLIHYTLEEHGNRTQEQFCVFEDSCFLGVFSPALRVLLARLHSWLSELSLALCVWMVRIASCPATPSLPSLALMCPLVALCNFQSWCSQASCCWRTRVYCVPDSSAALLHVPAAADIAVLSAPWQYSVPLMPSSLTVPVNALHTPLPENFKHWMSTGVFSSQLSYSPRLPLPAMTSAFPIMTESITLLHLSNAETPVVRSITMWCPTEEEKCQINSVVMCNPVNRIDGFHFKSVSLVVNARARILSVISLACIKCHFQSMSSCCKSFSQGLAKQLQ